MLIATLAAPIALLLPPRPLGRKARAAALAAATAATPVPEEASGPEAVTGDGSAPGAGGER